MKFTRHNNPNRRRVSRRTPAQRKEDAMHVEIWWKMHYQEQDRKRQERTDSGKEAP